MTSLVAVLSAVIACNIFPLLQAQDDALGRLVREAQQQSGLIAADINQWILNEGSELQARDHDVISRDRRSTSRKHTGGNRDSRPATHHSMQTSKHVSKAGKKTSKTVSPHSKVNKMPMRLHTWRPGGTNKNTHRPSKTHMSDRANKTKAFRSKKQAKKLSRIITRSKHTRQEAKKAEKKTHKITKADSKIAARPKPKQNVTRTNPNELNQRSEIARINPKVLKVFQRVSTETLTKYLQKKGLSEHYIKAIMKQVTGTANPRHSTKPVVVARKQKVATESVPTVASPLIGGLGTSNVKSTEVVKNKTGRARDEKDRADSRRKAENKSVTKAKKHRIMKQNASSLHTARKAKHKTTVQLSSKRSHFVKHEHRMAKAHKRKLAHLKHKIRKANDLKLRVAKALLSHCETQNRLKKVFQDVNKSLKKASVLAKAIGKKFGIKNEDVDKMTSEHTKEAIQEFLGKLF